MESKQKFVKRGPCEGVKVCSAENCSYTVANTQLRNMVPRNLSQEPENFLFILFISGPPTIRWLGVLTAEGEV